MHAIYSVMLDSTRSNKVIAVTGIQDVLINGESLGLGGYLDIGLIDTMGDLFVNFVGAFTFSAYGYFYSKSKGTKNAMVNRLMLTPREGSEIPNQTDEISEEDYEN